MSKWGPILGAVIAFAAMMGLPSRWVRYNECCYADGAIPGVTCCGRPETDAQQQSLTQHRDCCVPFVFEAAKLDGLTVSTPSVPTTFLAADGHSDSVEPWVSATIQNILTNLSPTGPPSASSPRYILLSCFLI